jgi:subtilisin family serine protease
MTPSAPRRLLPLTLAAVAAMLAHPGAQPQTPGSFSIPPDERPRQREKSAGQTLLVDALQYIHVPDARRDFGVTGQGQTAAVLDTGVRVSHVDFHQRIRVQRNFIGGPPTDVEDRYGHGTNVAGIIAARKKRKDLVNDPLGEHEGVAPDAQLAILKVLDDNGFGDFNQMADALDWVIVHHAAHAISVVNISISDRRTYVDDAGFATDRAKAKIAKLRTLNIPVVVSAGNEFFPGSKAGMGYPAILRDTISVGAFYDKDVGRRDDYRSGAKAFKTAAGRLTPFSQRLHELSKEFPAAVKQRAKLRTDIFAPGAIITSTGIDNDRGESDQEGTSQGAPVTTGVILLLQEYYRKTPSTLVAKPSHKRPSVDLLLSWLRAGSVPEKDVYGDDDNVDNTGLTYRRLDALAALQAARKTLTGS